MFPTNRDLQISVYLIRLGRMKLEKIDILCDLTRDSYKYDNQKFFQDL